MAASTVDIPAITLSGGRDARRLARRRAGRFDVLSRRRLLGAGEIDENNAFFFLFCSSCLARLRIAPARRSRSRRRGPRPRRVVARVVDDAHHHVARVRVLDDVRQRLLDEPIERGLQPGRWHPSRGPPRTRAGRPGPLERRLRGDAGDERASAAPGRARPAPPAATR